MKTSLAQTLAGHLEARTPAVLVVVTEAKGSTPRENGASMLVTADRVDGTIGGGRLEWAAVAEARALLGAGDVRREMTVALGPAIGQCCGGHVKLTLERADAQTLDRLRTFETAARAADPDVLIFGAGHVGRALAIALSPLPFKVKLIDARAAEFSGFQVENVTNVVTDRMTAEVDAAPANSAFLIMTHSHTLDALIATAALERADFAYLGIIGSQTKRKLFEAAFREQGIAASDIARVHCPIAASSVRDKRPAVIAALTAAELIATFASDTASGQVQIRAEKRHTRPSSKKLAANSLGLAS